MTRGEKIGALVELGNYIDQWNPEDRDRVFRIASVENPWFIPPFIRSALSGISHFLKKDILRKWLMPYEPGLKSSKTVGLILAGNIPLVGFHDLLCVLFSGHLGILKLSHQDRVLMTHLVEKLVEIEPRFHEQIRIVSKIEGVDAVIATGSDNTARYFHAYYQHLPHLIRKNRSSVAILNEKETEEDLLGLSDDIFLYFGLGCRNVSKIYVPADYDFDFLFSFLKQKHWLSNHQKYLNNYNYRKSCATLLDQKVLDGGFFLFEESESLVSPISVIYYSYYDEMENLKNTFQLHQDKIQTLVTRSSFFKNAVPFGKAQFPDPWDYADQVDTMDFLVQLA
jgi:hypothetical protein